MTLTYEIRKAAGWHGEPNDPIITTTTDEREARLQAGLRIDHEMPGDSNRYPQYAVVAETGEAVDRIDSFRCEECGELCEWGESGPTGIVNGDYASAGHEKHLITWVCEECSLGLLTDDDDE